MQSIDHKYGKRHFLYRDEDGAFRNLSVTTKAYAAYLRKLVDPDGGWIALGGRSPAEAIRHHCTGHISRSDHRLLKRTIDELLAIGHLQVGELDEDGEFLPVGSGDYVAIRDWIPAQSGMSKEQALAWYKQRADKAAQNQQPLARVTPVALAAAANDDTETHRQSTEAAPTMHRPCTDRSPSSQNSKGTELALFRNRSERIPPLSPKGESAGADKRDVFSTLEKVSDERKLAEQAVAWLNAQKPGARFRGDSQDARRQAKRWLKVGWDWRLVQKALALRLASLKASKPETWTNWVTPGTLFNRKLRRYVDEAQAGHTYRAAELGQAGGNGLPDDEAKRAAERAQRQAAEERDERRREAEAVFADVLEVVGLVGRDGDWESQLLHSIARTTIRALGWPQIVEQGEAIGARFVRSYMGER